MGPHRLIGPSGLCKARVAYDFGCGALVQMNTLTK